MLYTIMPMDLVIGNSPQGARRRMVRLCGSAAECAAGPGNEVHICRIYSSNPKDFLRAELSPGTRYIQE